jgi:hypothetical protein
VYRLLRGHYSSVFAPTDSCVNPVWLSSTSAFWPRSWSLCRLLPAPAATGILPTLSLRILPQMPGPVPRQVPQSAFTCFFLCVIGLPRVGIGSASRFVPRTRLFAACFSRLQTFLYVQASEFARLPDRSHRCASHRAAEAFTFGLNVLRCLRTHRICLSFLDTLTRQN